ncbi:MAG: hypothetical protein MPEBLZ_04024 [Candidatus Methanoperedens nitroreducens]|uniref:Uncharacterized protein n=1 Tax=Candidatus Methanoperedens nitratireducens TaxID=1392998 RepID=A0A0P8DV99_9EURY|nr:hypothetical protein [Candidatus Methanoperedens sp. BLZ2]KAB2942680.1 MAG: hypothetical protein F9K14_16975 [Candidatus Methanoperedens sp.]KPQ41425.1 MAG: hypothetical protein MPEBLZ_04024 [Candidatus Methanoperedens sp. BLZ1]MBZ0177472.1 hypothetical protein [Candidatus Methanoperedens nitroreducens]MCX9079166.1 hypothetical protein [Candidatus Methanoperedens sp.]
MVHNGIIFYLESLKGYAILIEAVFLIFINYMLFGNHERIINQIKNNVQSVTDILAILGASIVFLGFIYWLGYYIAAIKWNVDITMSGGGSLNENILPFGGLFVLAILISPLMIYLSRPQLSEIRKFIIINFGFVFTVGFINEYINEYLVHLFKL